MKHFLTLGLIGLGLLSCTSGVKTSTVLLTSEAGAKCESQKPIVFHTLSEEQDCRACVVVDPSDERQTLDGYGASLTESSAFVLATLTEEQRLSILRELFSEEGANFSFVRTQIGASDFSVEGKYSLAELDGDTELTSFSLNRDKEGFSKAQYPQIKNEQYDLYHLMKEVYAIKQAQQDKAYKILANTWTAPAWMKNNKKYYERENGFARGGSLLEEYYQTYANYLLRYLEAWREEGIEIWGMTPVNEPMGNDGGWESMDFPPAVEATFIADYMGPTLAANGFEDVKIYGFDQNTFESAPYAHALFDNDKASRYTAGLALHWYGHISSCFPEVLDSLHALYPEKGLLHTEGCIDNLGCPAWDAVADKEGFMESGWFNNDSFWWTASATDWAYTTPFWPEWHPKYSAVQRYAQYIIEGTNHWLTGFADWNCVLDSIGGPNHVNNFAAAPVMVDYENDIIYYTPYYYVLKQFSRTMRPGDVALGVSAPASDMLYVCATRQQSGAIAVNILNKAAEAINFRLLIDNHYADIEAPANSVMTLVVKL